MKREYHSINRWLLKAKAGDEESKVRLLEAFQPLILATYKSCAPVRRDREDLIQEGNLLVLQCIREYDPEKAPFPGYLRSRLRHHFLAYRRNILKENNLSLEAPDSSGRSLEDSIPDPTEMEEGILVREERKDLRLAFKNLTPKQQHLLHALYHLNLSPREYADFQGLSLSTVYNSRAKALKRLKKEYQKIRGS